MVDFLATLISVAPWTAGFITVGLLAKYLWPHIAKSWSSWRRNRKVGKCSHIDISIVMVDGEEVLQVMPTVINTPHYQIVQCTQCGANINKMLFYEHLKQLTIKMRGTWHQSRW